MPVKGRLTTGSKQTANSKPKDAGNLSDLLIPMGNKRVYVNYKGIDYAIEDVIKASGQVILLAEEDGKAIKANWLAEELKEATGLGVYLEIEGKLVPAQDVINSKIQAKKATAIEENEDSVTFSNESTSSIKDSLITLITMVFDATKGSEILLSKMVSALSDQEVISINKDLSSKSKLTKSQSSLLFTIKAELGKRNLTASKGKVNYNPHIGDQYLETEAADFVKPVFTDKDYEDFDAQVKTRFKVSAEVAEAGKDTLSITFEPIRGGVDLENPKFQSQLEDFIKFTFGGEFKKAVTDIDTVEEDYLVILVDYSKVKVLKAFDDSDLETEASPKVTPMLKKDHPELLKKNRAQMLVKKTMSLFSNNNKGYSMSANQYPKGSFGHWWTVIKGNEHIEGQIYKGKINCSNNNLTSLVGAPKEVIGDFYCHNNNLTSLEEAPQKVSGSFHCSNNNLTSLEGAPQKVNGDFFCTHNKLTSLEGAPQEVNGDFFCYDNNLTSLVGAPKEVGGDFSCYDNNLTSLKGAPRKVNGDFLCRSNRLTSLEGAPQKVNGDFYCGKNTVKFRIEDVEEVSNVQGTILT